MIGTPVDPLAAAAQRSRRRRRLGLGSLLALVVATVGARTVTAGPAHTALAGPLPLAPVSARGQRSSPTAAPVQEPSVPAAPTAVPTAAPRAAPTARPTALAPAATAPPVSAARTLTGQPVDVGYGTVQVRVTLAGTRIVGVSALSLPTGGRSDEISSYAEPLLQKEALKAQSASIDAVSGASYTSQGYAQSLQSALDAAR